MLRVCLSLSHSKDRLAYSHVHCLHTETVSLILLIHWLSGTFPLDTHDMDTLYVIEPYSMMHIS